MRRSPRVVLDASVIAKLYLPEIGSAKASAVLAFDGRKLAPDLLAAEFGNVLWKKVRKGELSQSEAEEIANAFTSACPVTLRPMGPYLPSALNIALRWKCTVYDALHHPGRRLPSGHRRRPARQGGAGHRVGASRHAVRRKLTPGLLGRPPLCTFEAGCL